MQILNCRMGTWWQSKLKWVLIDKSTSVNSFKDLPGKRYMFSDDRLSSVMAGLQCLTLDSWGNLCRFKTKLQYSLKHCNWIPASCSTHSKHCNSCKLQFNSNWLRWGEVWSCSWYLCFYISFEGVHYWPADLQYNRICNSSLEWRLQFHEKLWKTCVHLLLKFEYGAQHQLYAATDLIWFHDMSVHSCICRSQRMCMRDHAELWPNWSKAVTTRPVAVLQYWRIFSSLGERLELK
jgi:hypothetical protein